MPDLNVLLRGPALACGVLLGLGLLPPERAQAEQFEVQKLTPGDLAQGGGGDFGSGVAIWRDYIVVGAPGDSPPDDPGLASGAVYVFQFVNGSWIERAKLKGSDTGWEDQLGRSVAIDGDLIVAGAPAFTLEGSGMEAAAYVFRRDDNGTPDDGADDVWVEEAILTPDPSDRQFSDGFGGSVSISGDIIVAGAAGSGFYFADRAYVFRWDGADWLQEAILVGSDTQAGDRFGGSVSIWEDTVLVGARRDNGACPGEDPDCGAGAAYVFTRDSGTWSQVAKLTASDAPDRHVFGQAVAMSRSVAAVGARRAVYVFRHHSSWTEEQVLTPSDPPAGFGQTVSIDAFATAVGDAPACSVHSFRFDGHSWIEQAKVIASDARPGDQFGRTVGVSGAYAVVGGGGGAYVYVVIGDKLSLVDYAEFQNCFTGSGTNRSSACDAFDLVPDEKIDVKDYALFLERLTGP